MSEQRRRQQQGQVLVMSAAVMAFLFVPLCVFVIDTGLVAASYAQLGETLQAAAEDGASSIDQNAYRSSNGQQVTLDAAGAQQTADRSLRVSGMPGLQSWTVEVKGNTVTTAGVVKLPLLVLGTATLKESRSASFAYGQ
jgi:Flp pilus assembly protein TadG